MNQADPVAAIAAEQAQGMVVLRPGKAERPAQDHASNRNAETAIRVRRVGNHALDLGGQGRRHSLVGVDREHPVAGRQRERKVALAGEVVKRAHRDDLGHLPGDFQRRDRG